MNYLKIFALFFIYFLSINNVFAEKYFGSDSISPTMIDKPFSMNSKEHKDEIKQVILIQKNLEPQEIDLALKEKQLRPETVVQHVNKKITRKKFPNLLRKHSEVHFSNCCCKTFWRKSGKSRFPLKPEKLE